MRQAFGFVRPPAPPEPEAAAAAESPGDVRGEDVASAGPSASSALSDPTLVVADYGQLELRILAHMTDCKCGGGLNTGGAQLRGATVRGAVGGAKVQGSGSDGAREG